MGSTSETHYLRSIMSSLPTEIASKIRNLCVSPSNESLLENLVRLLSGASHTSDASMSLSEQWSEKQTATKVAIAGLSPLPTDKKRTREDEMDEDSQQSKRQRVSPTTSSGTGNTTLASQDPGTPLFTLHSLSATSPVRKKVDITIHQHAIVFTNPSTKALESTVSLSSIKRAFIVPTRGKSKPHWTVILLSGDIPDNTKPKGKGQPNAAPSSSENQQVIFGIDASTPATFKTTSYDNNSEPTAETHPKNTTTLPHIRSFLFKLTIPVIHPSASVFKSACTGVGSSAGTDGIPGVEAYRGAKSGNLWFSAEGILWGESKPCEFWAVGDLIGREDGVKMVGSGRTCSIILTRRTMGAGVEDDMEGGEGASMDVDGEETGEETEFGMVDSKEREGINDWLRAHRNLFGTNGRARQTGVVPKEDVKGKGKASPDSGKSKAKANAGPVTIRTLLDDDDEEDDDFSAETSDLDGSEAMSGESSSESGKDNGGSDDEDGEKDAEGSDEEEGDGEVDELDPAHHPLLRPGAMPRMSKAALEMAVGIVEDALTGVGEKSDEEEEADDDLEYDRDSRCDVDEEDDELIRDWRC